MLALKLLPNTNFRLTELRISFIYAKGYAAWAEVKEMLADTAEMEVNKFKIQINV
ncbi:hypothetical protein [Acinetobacter pittii]|uniref:hypothetical protein n=1 Tax=Acinetobacter pittii TaxID=48296 RepID=UPI000ABCA4BE|nr:hypothetical protein [Acinetobacter pittii]